MRLWHKDMIKYLPNQQLVSQYRELCCIAVLLAKNHTPNHILVNYVLNDLSSFVMYSYMVRLEMTKRGYRTMDNVWNKIVSVVSDDSWKACAYTSVFPNEHNNRYLTQCYYNLQEKYDRGGMSESDWQGIANLMKGKEL